jgi:hypothetical protein
VYQETAIPRVERGPQPERSPVLARFEAPSGAPGTISVLARKAQIFKQTLLQARPARSALAAWLQQPMLRCDMRAHVCVSMRMQCICRATVTSSVAAAITAAIGV